MLILLLILYDPSTLVYPPFSHTLGYHKGTLTHLRLATGKSIDEIDIGAISVVKLQSQDDPGTPEDDDELTMFATGLISNSIYFNIGLSDLGVYESPISGEDALWQPSDCEIETTDTLWVVDRMHNRITRFYFNGTNLKFLDSFGKFGILDACFDDPRQISVTGRKVYVSDYGNNRIQIFNHGGEFQKEIGGLIFPTGVVAVDGNEKWLRHSEPFIISIDSGKSRITKFTSEGMKISSVSVRKLSYRRVRFEFADIDYYGLIWITDSYNNCIHLFDRNLKYVVKFGRLGTGEKEFIEPRGISIWRRFGQVFVSDSRSIQYFWVGVDAWIKGIKPGIFKPGEGVTVSFYLTQPADLKVNIYDSENRIIRKMDFGRFKDVGQNYIIWDTIDENGKYVSKGKYIIEMIFKPTYSSKGKFEKRIKTEVHCNL